MEKNENGRYKQHKFTIFVVFVTSRISNWSRLLASWASYEELSNPTFVGENKLPVPFLTCRKCFLFSFISTLGCFKYFVTVDVNISSLYFKSCFSRADRRKNLLYRRTIPFCFHIVPWRLVSTFLYVGDVRISCGFLPTRFSLNFVLNSITVKNVKFQINF